MHFHEKQMTFLSDTGNKYVRKYSFTLSTLLAGFNIAGTFLSTRFFNHRRKLHTHIQKVTE